MVFIYPLFIGGYTPSYVSTHLQSLPDSVAGVSLSRHQYINLGRHATPKHPPPGLSATLLPPPQGYYLSMSLQSHLSVLESSVQLYPTRPAFRLPIVNKETSQVSEWATVTYAQFHQDVELYARYWASVLSADGLAPGSTVGLWYVPHFIPESMILAF